MSNRNWIEIAAGWCLCRAALVARGGGRGGERERVLFEIRYYHTSTFSVRWGVKGVRSTPLSRERLFLKISFSLSQQQHSMSDSKQAGGEGGSSGLSVSERETEEENKGRRGRREEGKNIITKKEHRSEPKKREKSSEHLAASVNCGSDAPVTQAPSQQRLQLAPITCIHLYLAMCPSKGKGKIKGVEHCPNHTYPCYSRYS